MSEASGLRPNWVFTAEATFAKRVVPPSSVPIDADVSIRMVALRGETGLATMSPSAAAVSAEAGFNVDEILAGDNRPEIGKVLALDPETGADEQL